MKKTMGLLLLVLLFLTACGQTAPNSKLQKVGLLVPETVNDQVWGTKGYKGLLRIQSDFDVDVYYKEGINNEAAMLTAVEEFKKEGITLLFGHGSEYAHFFSEIAEDYPEIHFVCFNSDVRGDNVTSLNFEGNAMGFFGGMVAGKMTETNSLGVIAAFEWQPEVDGFFEGVLYENPDATVYIDFTQDWDSPEIALSKLDEMLENGVDVIYPAGDGFNLPVINMLKDKGLFAIGFVSDQADLGENTVLTSTVQHIPELYALIVKRYLAGELESGSLYFDFQDDVISLGDFSPLVSEEYKNDLQHHIERYKESGLLPNQQESGKK